jgi:phospholipase/carboxylesterase
MDTATNTAAATVTGWPHVYSPGKPGAPVLLMLHGTGGNQHEIAALATELNPDAGVLAPRGPVTEHGMLRWFRRHGEGHFDVDDVITRAGDLAGFLSAAREHYHLGQRPVIAVGFSNGANIALATAMLHPHTLENVIAFSGMYPFGDRDTAADLTGSNLLVLNGDADPMAPLPSVTTLIAALTNHGATFEQVLRPGGHGIEYTDLAAAHDWLTRHAARQQSITD